MSGFLRGLIVGFYSGVPFGLVVSGVLARLKVTR